MRDNPLGGTTIGHIAKQVAPVAGPGLSAWISASQQFFNHFEQQFNIVDLVAHPTMRREKTSVTNAV